MNDALHRNNAANTTGAIGNMITADFGGHNHLLDDPRETEDYLAAVLASGPAA